MYLASYRKWRPRSFDDVIGQEHVSDTLRRQVQSGRLSHAYLFVGTRGTGKTTCARILAKAINCLQPENGNPCNKCPACTGIDNDSILDVVELDAASNNGVDHVRDLREKAIFSPVDVKKRVYIIDEVHMLSTPAFNALLKILEEPPEHLVFILATTEIHKVPATILSRCQRYSFKRILPEQISKHLLYIAGLEGFELTDDAAGLLSRLADGSIRDALSLMDQCATGGTVDYNRVVSAFGLAGSSETAAILSAAMDNDVPKALTILDRLYNDGKVMTAVLEGLQSLIRDVLLVSLMPNGSQGLLSGNFDEDVIKGFAGRSTPARLMTMSDILRGAQAEMSRDTGGKLAAELCLIRLSDKRTDDSPSALTQRVAALEQKLDNNSFAVCAPESPATDKAAAQSAPSVPEPPAPISPGNPGPGADENAAAPSGDTPAGDVEDGMPDMPEAPPNSPCQKKQAQQKENASAGNIWPDILALIKPVVDMPVYPVLANQVTAALDGNTLVISAKAPFAYEQLNKSAITAAVRDAIPKAAGKMLPMRIVLDNAGAVGTTDKLDALKKFDSIVTFES